VTITELPRWQSRTTSCGRCFASFDAIDAKFDPRFDGVDARIAEKDKKLDASREALKSETILSGATS